MFKKLKYPVPRFMDWEKYNKLLQFNDLAINELREVYVSEFTLQKIRSSNYDNKFLVYVFTHERAEYPIKLIYDVNASDKTTKDILITIEPKQKFYAMFRYKDCGTLCELCMIYSDVIELFSDGETRLIKPINVGFEIVAGNPIYSHELTNGNTFVMNKKVVKVEKISDYKIGIRTM